MNTLELAEKLKRYKLVSGYATYCHKAADELLRQHAEIQQWRNVFGFLGTPDELGNEWNALKEVNSRQHEAIVKLREALDELTTAGAEAWGTERPCVWIGLDVLKDTEGL